MARHTVATSQTPRRPRHAHKQITTGSVKECCALAWLHPGRLESQESTPLIVGDTMYVTTVDRAEVCSRWMQDRKLNGSTSRTRQRLLCDGVLRSGQPAAWPTPTADLRGAASMPSWWRSTPTAGKVLWTATVADYKKGHAITSPPLPYKNLVVSGMAGR